jgi:hypothetical protein
VSPNAVKAQKKSVAKAKKAAAKVAFAAIHPPDKIGVIGATYGVHMLGKATAPKLFQVQALAKGLGLLLDGRPLPDSLADWRRPSRIPADSAMLLSTTATIFDEAQCGAFSVAAFGKGRAQHRFNSFVKVQFWGLSK